MPVPKQRHTKSRRNKRRMHLFLKKPTLSVCSKCGKEVLPHILCGNCGFYKGREVIDIFKKMNKREKKIKKKEMKEESRERLSMEELSKNK